MVRAIVGANWGDEGKGKITDMFASQADMVIRFQGGANAGHTIINDYGKFALHLLPSGVCLSISRSSSRRSSMSLRQACRSPISSFPSARRS